MLGDGETMGKIPLSVFAILLSTSWVAAGCEDSKAYFVNEKLLPEKADLEIDLEEQESHEGGAFFVYLDKKKKPERIVRIDFGLTGRLLTKIAIGAPNDIMITVTKQNYNVPFTEPGSMTVHEESDFYFFCDGKLLQEPGAESTSDYAKAAREGADTLFKSQEIASQLKASQAIAPRWP
jgi:hypothetical protein